VERQRSLTDSVLRGRARSFAILLIGARQSGKSFLMKAIAKMAQIIFLPRCSSIGDIGG
jgi:hypothetical protein